MKKLAHFLVYNNTVPLIFGVIFLGASATFAASPAARATVVNPRTTITSVDNSFLLNTDLSTYPISIEVRSVNENAAMYFVEYQLKTIDVVSAIWMPQVKTKTLEIQKEVLDGADLGLYITKQLSEVHSAELARLQETQKSQRSRGITQKVMSTEYDGLIGSFLDPTQEVLEGYTAVVTETQPEITNPLSEAEIRAQQKEQKRLQEEKNTFVVGDEEVVIDEITNNPDPDPGPTPVPTPEPVPEPEPTPDPEPEPAPEPEATPESAPEPVSEIEPATDPVL